MNTLFNFQLARISNEEMRALTFMPEHCHTCINRASAAVNGVGG